MNPSFVPTRTRLVDRPLADAGLESYRYQLESGFGWIMIGAVSHAQAISQANLRLSKGATMNRLQIWSGSQYVAATPDNDPQETISNVLDRRLRPSN